MSLFRTNVVQLYSVNNVIVDDFINLKSNFQISSDKNIDNFGSIKIQNLQIEKQNKHINAIISTIQKDWSIHQQFTTKKHLTI